MTQGFNDVRFPKKGIIPKDKAEELIETFSEYVDSRDDRDYAVRRAIICVEEILKDQNGTDATIGNKSWWWNEVINALKAMQ